jgi:Ca2+-binding EF-hand superfamily protein
VVAIDTILNLFAHSFQYCLLEQLNVGIGTMAGSTIMLLTMPWFLSVIGGRVNLDAKTNEPLYKNHPKLDPPDHFTLTTVGVELGGMVHIEAYIMILTSLTYLVLQIPGMMYINNTKAEQAEGEKIFAQIGAGLCLFFFAGYLYFQYQHSNTPDSRQDQTRDEYVRNAIAQKKITLLGVMMTEYKAELRERMEAANTSSYHQLNTSATETTSFSRSNSVHPTEFSDRYMKRLRKLLRPFFKVYDVDNSNSLQLDELRVLFEDLGESLSKQEVNDIFVKFDKDRNGEIEYDEFVEGICEYILQQRDAPEQWNAYQQQGHGRGMRSRTISKNSNLVRRCFVCVCVCVCVCV